MRVLFDRGSIPELFLFLFLNSIHGPSIPCCVASGGRGVCVGGGGGGGRGRPLPYWELLKTHKEENHLLCVCICIMYVCLHICMYVSISNPFFVFKRKTRI